MNSPVSEWRAKQLSMADQPSPELEAIYRKVTLRLVPFLFLCWMINYLDRINIGFAKLPLAHDIGLTEAAYGLGIGLFTVGYVLFEVPSNLLLQRVGARKTLTRIMLLWGLVSCAMPLIRSPIEFYVARFLLGVAEAGFYPGLILYLTFWFPSARRARVTSRFLLAMAMAGIIGGPLAGLILGNSSGMLGLRNWQWLFLLEGLPAVAMGCIAYFYLDDGPQQATWLSPVEKDIVLFNLSSDDALKHAHRTSKFFDVFRDTRVYIAVAGYTVVPLLGTVLNYWTPTIINQTIVGDIRRVSLLSAVPFVLGAIGMLAIAQHSDSRLERRWHFFLSVCIGAVALVILPSVTHSLIFSIACLSLVGIAYYAGSTIFWTMPPAYFPAATVGAGIAVTSSLGQVGAVLAPVLLGWLKTHTDSIATGLYAIAALTVVGGLAIVIGLPKSMLRERHATLRG